MLKELTHEETLDRIIKINKLIDDDNWDEAMALTKASFPMPAVDAKAAYETFGKDFVLSLGFDLSEAEAAYGPDWLDK